MKKVLFASVFVFAALSASSYAADMPVKALPQPIYDPWNGCYLGGNVGYSWGHATTDVTTPAIPPIVPQLTYTHSNSLDGAIAGGQLGCNWHAATNWVWGLEADIQWSGEKGTFTANDPFSFPTIPTTGIVAVDPDTKITWFGTVRGRVGYLWNNWLFYATGGLAYGGLEVANGVVSETGLTGVGLRIPFTQTAALTSGTSKVNTGWTVGGGVELPLAQRWTFKVEYLYMDLGKVNASGTTNLGTTIATSTHFTDNIVRVGLNYQFWTH